MRQRLDETILNCIQCVLRTAEESVRHSIGRITVRIEQLFQSGPITESDSSDQLFVSLRRCCGRAVPHDAAYTPFIKTAAGRVLFAPYSSRPDSGHESIS